MLSESKRSAALMHFFLLVHGGIGLLEHFVYVDDAVAPGQMHKAAAETLVIPWGSCLGEIILYVGDLPLGQLQGAAAQNGAELVATHSGKDVRGTETPLYEVGEAEQIFVALGVAIGVVDEFEVVEVTIAEDQLVVGFQQCVQLLVEIIAVADAGQRVKMGLQLQRVSIIFSSWASFFRAFSRSRSWAVMVLNASENSPR